MAGMAGMAGMFVAWTQSDFLQCKERRKQKA